MESGSVPFSNSSCGTSSECGTVQFTPKEACTPTACACVIMAILFLSLGTSVGVYFGLRFLDMGKATDRVYKGSFVVIGGDKYVSSLSDALSDVFQEKAANYKGRLDTLYKSSVYKSIYLHSEILAFNKQDGQNLIVHFNLHLSPEPLGLSSADLYVILSEEVVRSKTGVFKDLEIDQESIQVQERKPPTDDVFDKWVPRRQYPGYVEGLPPPTSSSASRITRRRCTTINVPFCHRLPYNQTSYPNIVGHRNFSELMVDLVTYRQIMDFECYPLAQEFICQLLQPECQNDKMVMPCRNFCEEFWKSCKAFLPRNVMDTLDCSAFPQYTEAGACRRKPDCSNELKARGMSSKLCDGVVDCKDASDETTCGSCPPDFFLCGDAQCVPRERRCDSRKDCWNGADERNCMSVSPGDWLLKDSLYAYSPSGYILYWDSGDSSRICVENLNDTLPASRKDVVIQSLAASTCSALHYDKVKNVYISKDTDANPSNYVQLLDPMSSSKTFVPASCDTQDVLYVECASSACGLRPASTNRTFSPGQAKYGQWPWHVALFSDSEYACDGTLVSDQWILTTATCLEGRENSDWTARLGIVRLSSSSPFDQESSISAVMKSLSSAHIALLKLEKPINGSDYVRPVCIPNHDYSSTGIPCTTLRWKTGNNHLHDVQLRITKDCSDHKDTSSSWSDSDRICAIPSRTIDDEECQVEEPEGSPLLCSFNDRWYIIGVSSQKIPCNQPNEKRFFHSIANDIQWIRHTFDIVSGL